MSGEGKKPPSSQALALLYLRSKRDWPQKALADRMGLADEKQISRYERGAKPLSRKMLDSFAAGLGYPPEAVEALLFLDAWIEPKAPEQPESFVSLPPEARRAIDRTCLTLSWSLLDAFRREMGRAVEGTQIERARKKAQDLWARLKPATPQQRRVAVAAFAELQTWALAELVCHESERAAAHKVEMAQDLAELALFIAGRIPDERLRSQVEGYCWAYIANARRVANDLSGADKAFVRAWDLWRVGAPPSSNLLPEWRLFDLEASLRRAERRFSEALALLDQARTAAGQENIAANARILLKKEHVFDQMGETEKALATMAEAKPYVEISGDSRLLFAVLFKTANNLCHLRQYQDAANRLSEVRELAVRQSNELDLIRVGWLQARVAVGQGRRDEAVAGLEQVRREFTVRCLPYDAALASLELAVLYLEEERTAEVRKLAQAMGWVFQAQGITREALASLNLFLDAAQRDAATVELAQRIAAELKQIRASAPSQKRQKGQG